MASITLSTKGRITIPKKIRDCLELRPGTQLDFSINCDGKIVIRRVKPRTEESNSRFEAVRGKADVMWRTKELMTLLHSEG